MKELVMALIDKDKLIQAVNRLMDEQLKGYEEAELFRSIDPKQTDKWQDGFYVEQLDTAKAMYEANEYRFVEETVQGILSSLGDEHDAEDLFRARQLLMEKDIELFTTLIKNISSGYYLSKDENATKDVHQNKLERLELAKLKDTIDAKDFELLYGYSKEAQKGFRNRLNNPLPSIPKPFGSKIQYRKIDVEDWLNNQK